MPIQYLLIPSSDPIGWIIGLLFIASMGAGIYASAKHASSVFPQSIMTVDKKYLEVLFGQYWIWGTVQQALCCLAYIGIMNAFNVDTRIAVIIVSMLFCWIHTPNIFLIFATAGMGQLYLLHFSEYHNLWLIGFGHGFLASMTKWLWPEEIHHNFRIWGRY